MVTIKERREQLGMTQAELGEMVDVSQAAVCRWETGDTAPLRKLHAKIAEALRVPVAELDFSGGNGKRPA